LAIGETRFTQARSVCFKPVNVPVDRVGIGAGLLTGEDARGFVRSGLADRCRRVLIEPLDADKDTALRHAARMEDIVVSAGITLEQVHHGVWPAVLGRESPRP
jgi:hypothetical protein